MFILVYCYQINALYDVLNKTTDAEKDYLKELEKESEPSNTYYELKDKLPQKIDKDDLDSDNKEIMDDLKALDLKKSDSIPIPPADDALSKIHRLDELTKAFNESFDLDDNVSSLTDKNMWEKLYNYIKENLKDFYVDGHISIELQIRYVFCSYIVAFIPAQFAFVIPGFYTYLIPKRAYKVPIISDALLGLKYFLKFVKGTSRDSLFITFYFGRRNSLLEDIEFIKKVPELISNDPIGLLREILAFTIKAQGYDPKKYN